jgi:hypothetical protein
MLQTIAAMFLGAAIATAVSAQAAQPATTDECRRACTSAAQRVQDVARTLRNGVTTGAGRAALERERVALAAALHGVAGAEEAWLATLDDEARIRLHDSIALMADHRQEMTSHLEELTSELRDGKPDGRRVQALARSLSRHAAGWEQALRRPPAAAR